MSSDDDSGTARAGVLDFDEVQDVLSGSFYTPEARAEPRRTRSRRSKSAASRPQHYKVICISMYNHDLEKLDQLVDELKARGLTKANRSALIRAALDQVDLDKIPRGM